MPFLTNCSNKKLKNNEKLCKETKVKHRAYKNSIVQNSRYAFLWELAQNFYILSSPNSEQKNKNLMYFDVH